MAPVQMFAVALVVVHEGRHLGDGGGRVGRGAHGAVLLPPLTPLGLVLHPLPLQSRLDLDHKDNRRKFLKVPDGLKLPERSGTTIGCETNAIHSCKRTVTYELTLTSMVKMCHMDGTKLNRTSQLFQLVEPPSVTQQFAKSCLRNNRLNHEPAIRRPEPFSKINQRYPPVPC